jgi:hypothetical protein
MLTMYFRDLVRRRDGLCRLEGLRRGHLCRDVADDLE